jgi:hypothetical protein
MILSGYDVASFSQNAILGPSSEKVPIEPFSGRYTRPIASTDGSNRLAVAPPIRQNRSSGPRPLAM